MDILGMPPMLARLMAITARTGSMAACLLGPDPGSTALEGGSLDVPALGAGLPDVALPDADVMDVAGLRAAAVLHADQLVEDSAAPAVAASTVEVAADSVPVGAGSTEAAVGSTAVAEATAAATGN